MITDDGTIVYCKCGKRCYTTAEAGYIINCLKRKHYRKTKSGDIPKRKYFCNECGFYHLTHTQNKRKKKWNRA